MQVIISYLERQRWLFKYYSFIVWANYIPIYTHYILESHEKFKGGGSKYPSNVLPVKRTFQHLTFRNAR